MFNQYNFAVLCAVRIQEEVWRRAKGGLKKSERLSLNIILAYDYRIITMSFALNSIFDFGFSAIKVIQLVVICLFRKWKCAKDFASPATWLKAWTI